MSVKVYGINHIAIGGAAFALVLIFNQPGASKEVPSIESSSWILIALAFVCAAALHGLLYYTPWGLRVRACGENPHAVAAAGLLLGGSAAQYADLFENGLHRSLNRAERYTCTPALASAELGNLAGAVGAAVMGRVGSQS